MENMSNEPVMQGLNMQEPENKKKHRWYESLPVAYGETFLLLLIGQLIGSILLGIFYGVMLIVNPFLAQSDYFLTGIEYGLFIGIWIVGVLYFALIKPYRVVLKKLVGGSFLKGVFKFLFGLLLGFATNGVCILVAALNDDIKLFYDNFDPVVFFVILLMVFIQSSAEELLCRGFLYQKLLKRYNSVYVAIIGNSLLFALLHLGNDGVTVLSIINIFLAGVLMSLPVYFLDSLWCAMAIHTAWNFTQNIIFGLPNSGNVMPYSVFKLDAASARDSFAYNVGFGIEGTLFADVVLLLTCIIFWCIGTWIKKSKQIKNEG